jgi:hypothetical protein
MSKEDVENLLKAFEAQNQKVQQDVQKKQGATKKTTQNDKDW